MFVGLIASSKYLSALLSLFNSLHFTRFTQCFHGISTDKLFTILFVVCGFKFVNLIHFLSIPSLLEPQFNKIEQNNLNNFTARF